MPLKELLFHRIGFAFNLIWFIMKCNKMVRLPIRTKEYWREYRRKYYLQHKEEMDKKSKQWAKNNKFKVNKKSREWRKNNPEKRKLVELRYKCKIYGISLEEYEKMFEKQNGLCAVCGNTNLRYKKSLSIDHCHKTNMVRGLLCDDCNLAIGLMNDDIKILKKAVKYLKEYEK